MNWDIIGKCSAQALVRCGRSTKVVDWRPDTSMLQVSCVHAGGASSFVGQEHTLEAWPHISAQGDFCNIEQSELRGRLPLCSAL